MFLYLTKLKNIGDSFSIALIFSFLHIPQLVNVVTKYVSNTTPGLHCEIQEGSNRIVHPVSNTQS